MADGDPAQISRPSEFEGAEERRLVEAGQRDPARFGDLYEHSFEVVYAYISRRVRDRSEAEDLTAEVLAGPWQTCPVSNGPERHSRPGCFGLPRT